MIDTQAIRSKILDLAMRGKLTEQLPEDGTAEELYQQIQKEKQALIKAGRIKKVNPLTAITNAAIPFTIPDSWKWIRWGDIVNIVSARRVHQADWSKTGVPFYRAREIAKLAENGYVKNELFISEELYKEFSKSGVPHENDLMVSAVGTLGRTYVVQKDDRFYYKDASVLCFENFGDINPYFLALVMRSNVMRAQIESNSGGTTVDTLTMVRMVKYLIPLPPLAEQHRIVARIEQAFSALDTIDTLQAKYADNLTVLKSKLIDAAIQGKLTEQLPEDGTAEELYQQIQAEKQTLIKAGKIKKEKTLPKIAETPYVLPDGWAWTRWGELSFQIQYGYNAPAQEKGRIRMVRITDIQNNQIIWNTVPYCNIDDNCIAEYLLKPNNILFARTGGTVGKSYLVEKVEEDAVFAGYLIRTSFSSSLSAKYIKYFMESRLYWKQLQDGTTATAQPNCNAQTLSKMMVPLPPLAEQKRIVAKLEELLPLCERLE